MTSGPRSSRRPIRAALTLVEIILVLALLVVISSLTVPLLSKSISHSRLQHSGDLVRAAWGRARLAAMRSGESYVFRFEPKGSRFQIVKLAATTAEDADTVNMLPPESAADAEYADGDILRLARSRLLEEIVFASGQVAAVPQMAAPAATIKTDWSPPIVFYPDGTASDASVLLSNPAGLTLTVTLRGLTGISRAGQIGSEGAP